MDEDSPYFRFHPGCYMAERAFDRTDDVCGICSRPCVWKYAGAVYTSKEVPTVCARCISNGFVGKFLGGDDFSLHDIYLSGADAALEEELFRRTPGVACFNPFEWPVLDGKPLAFVGYADDEELITSEDVYSAVREALEAVGSRFDGPTPYVLVFKEIDGESYRAVVDFD